MTRALVVGRGSIGTRHADVLTGLGCDVAHVSRRATGTDAGAYVDIGTALADFAPEYVVLARETSAHLPDLETLGRAGYEGSVLVEKPLAVGAVDLPPNEFAKLAVAYNLRFHPLLARMRDELRNTSVLSANVYAGQHLAQWRPGTDFRSAYSADTARGGGVLRDLSHELDYTQWLLGGWVRVCATGGNSGSLSIKSDDHWGILLATDRCPLVAVQINYLDHIGQRTITVNTPDSTIHADLVRSELTINDQRWQIESDRDLTYRRQHEAMLFGREADLLCSAEEGQRVMTLISAIERSERDDRWVPQR